MLKLNASFCSLFLFLGAGAFLVALLANLITCEDDEDEGGTLTDPGQLLESTNYKPRTLNDGCVILLLSFPLAVC